MSDMNTNGWPFGEDTSGEGLNIDAIFGGGSPGSDENPFEALAAQQAKPAAPATPPAPVALTKAVENTPAQSVQTTPVAPTPAPTPAAAPAVPEDNPISAAFAKQEEAAVQTAAKSLFEKAPVFSYGSAKEEITDPAQTFEELRIAKSDDFPELSEGKRVSWTVEYGNAHHLFSSLEILKSIYSFIQEVPARGQAQRNLEPYQQCRPHG